MRRLTTATLALLAALAVGCGGGEKALLPKDDLTEEQKAKVKQEDALIADEESQGKGKKK